MKAPTLPSIFRFRLSTALWIMALFGVGLAWWIDRQTLEDRIARIETQLNPASVDGWSLAACLGEPDEMDGSGSSAWCPATADGSPEWLEVTYKRSVNARAVRIHETYVTGAVVKITAFDSRNREVVLWQGSDPTPPGKKGLLSVKVDKKVRTNRIKIYLDCPNTPGWNCIDAVALIDSWGFTHWAESANASSSYNGSTQGRRFIYNR